MTPWCQKLSILPVLVAVATIAPRGNRSLRAQFIQPFGLTSQFDLDDTVQLDEADSSVLAQLERFKAHVADRQWDEAVETLRQVMEASEGKLMGVTQRRYVSLHDYVHLQLAGLPDEALKLYRGRVDPVARQWYEEGVARRDRKLFDNVLREAFASSFGDDALMALGEMAIERGDCPSARWYWERIVPAELPAEAPRTWPGYPDTDLDLAAVRARLVLASIMEGSLARAGDELTQFTRLHGDAKGRFGGRETNYAEALGALLAESAAWPKPEPSTDWPTFAGNLSRNGAAANLIDVGKVAWRTAWNTAADADAGTLNCHPLLVGDLVLVNDRLEIMAFRADSGRPAWGEVPAVFRAELEGVIPFSVPSSALGTPQFTMTAVDGKLYARMGTAVTSSPQRRLDGYRPGYLVCLDLTAEGRLMWKITPEEGWAMEGSPIADGANVYAGMRRSDVRPQAHVACFDAQTGRRRWRRFICGAETPGRGVYFESTHNLLTLQGETLYYNTNLGAVAGLSVADGRVRWISLYPRALRGDASKPAPHWQRQLNPCLCDGDTLLVAPADSPRIFAFDAATGQMLWQTGDQLQDAIHLLGTTDEHLIAGGGKLYWIGLKGAGRGRIEHVWPDGPERPGFGRGLLSGDRVLWPTREKIYVFDARSARPTKTFDLLPRGVGGGNLVVSGGGLLIATGSELIAVSPHGGKREGGDWGLGEWGLGVQDLGLTSSGNPPPDMLPSRIPSFLRPQPLTPNAACDRNQSSMGPRPVRGEPGAHATDMRARRADVHTQRPQPPTPNP